MHNIEFSRILIIPDTCNERSWIKYPCTNHSILVVNNIPSEYPDNSSTRFVT